MISTQFSRKRRAYTGQELRPHFLLTELRLRGSALAAFIGPCHVKTEHLVDWEDRLQNDRIEAKEMVHFIGEFFGASLREGVLLQRLFMATIAQTINQSISRRKSSRAPLVSRDGDDLFWKERKLSVSIVTASPVSQLLHVGINVDPAGAPVPAVGLAELGVRPREWIPEVLRSISDEWSSVEWACAKVRPVM